MMNKVLLNGVVETIDLTKRDVTLITDTPVKSKPVKVTVHFWKAPSDGPDPAWANRPEWKDRIAAGMSINVEGHMGNNGRIIAEGYGIPGGEPEADDETGELLA